MQKIKLLLPLWNGKRGETLEVTEQRAEWAIRKGKAIKVEAKPRKAPKNKAETAKNNK